MSRTTKPARRFTITAPQLPACEFSSREAILGNVRGAFAVQALLDQLNRDGDADAFAVDADALGMFEWREIDQMARTRKRPAELYA